MTSDSTHGNREAVDTTSRFSFVDARWLLCALLVLVPFASPPGPNIANASETVGAACRVDFNPPPPLPDPSASLEETLLALSERGCKEISGREFGRAAVKSGLSRMAGRVESLIGGDREPHKALAAIGRVVYQEEKFVYDGAGTDDDLYMLDRVIERKRGNCLGLTLLYAMIGERIGLPLTGSYIPGHIFVRYDSGAVRINVETSRYGDELSDAEYRRVFKLEDDRPYLRTLDKKGIAAVFIKTVGASCSCGRKDEASLRLYDEASRLYPELADIHFNTGVSLQRTGRPKEAAEEYRKCLALDPGLSVAQKKLDSAAMIEAESCDLRRAPPGTGEDNGAWDR